MNPMVEYQLLFRFSQKPMNTAEKPRLTSDVRYYEMGAEGVLLESESEGVIPLKGPLWRRLLPLLDGTKTVRELARSFEVPGELFEIYRALFLLKGRQLIEDGPAPEDAAQRFWKVPRAAAPRVRIERIGRSDSELMEQLLAMTGIAVDCSAPVSVVLTDDYRRTALGEINRRHLQSGHPWLLMKCEGKRSWVGPVFTPGHGPCWECLASRLKVNQNELEYVEGLSLSPTSGPLEASCTPATRMLVAMAVPVLERVCLTGNAGSLASTVWTIDLNKMTHEDHHVVRRPQCPACGDPTLAGGSAEFQLQPSAKEARSPLLTSPWLTYERFRRHVSPISGAVAELQPGLLDDNPFHLFSSGTNRATSIRSTDELMAFSLRSRSGGKGSSREQAIAGALAEGLERYSCSWRGDGRAIRARMSDLGRDAVNPRDILAFSDAQYAARAEINERGERYYRVPEIFDPGQIIEWTPVRSLTSGNLRFVPTALCWFGYPASFAHADSNGCAAGNNLEEAILQGLCELIERDSVAIWWYNQIRRPAIDLATLQDPWCSSMLQTFHAQYGRRVEAIDLTTDLGIPVAAVISYRKGSEKPEFFFGLGAHLDPAIAVRRAFTEMCQFFGSFTAWAGAADGSLAGSGRNMDPGMAAWLANAHHDSQPQMTPTLPARAIQDLPHRQSASLFEDIQYVVGRLESVGVEVLALDCTQPDIGMPVTRVFAPGLRHFWARFGPGRLYDVPVKLGWLSRSKPEQSLNPIAMFF